MYQIFSGIKSLLFPEICLICSMPGFRICPKCNFVWLSTPKCTKVNNFSLDFVADYNEEIGQLLLLAKESGNKTSINTLSSALTECIKALIQEKQIKLPINIIPIPSSKQAIRRRGRDHIDVLCAEVIKKLLQNSIMARKVPILMHIKKNKDQSNLTRQQRFENLKNAYTLNGPIPSTGVFILLDDVMTTGSSISEAVRALSEAKITILGAVTACAVGRNSLIR